MVKNHRHLKFINPIEYEKSLPYKILKSPCRVLLDVRIEHYQENWVETTALFQQLACLTN